MHIIIAGGTGLIGRRLTEYWLKQNHTITIISRSIPRIEKAFGTRVQGVTWEKLTADVLKQGEVVINLTGEGVTNQRWNENFKKELVSSRVGSTKKLATMLAEIPENPPPLINAGGIGIYGLQAQLPDRLPPKLDENTPIDWDKPTDFLSALGRNWEKAADPAVQRGIRVVFVRFGVVLAKEGGALPKLTFPFKYFVGGPIGTGNQPFSWVSIDDVIRAIEFLISKPDLSGAFNVVAPDCVSQHVFAQTIARILNRPDVVRVPSFIVKLKFGQEMAQELLLEGQRVFPQRLLDAGFKFLYPDIESAINHVLLEPGIGMKVQRKEEAQGLVDMLMTKAKIAADKIKKKNLNK